MYSNKVLKVDVLKEYKAETQRKIISFLNPASIGILLKDPRLFDGVSFFIDGMMLSMFLSILTGKRVQRTSFDFTSIAADVLDSTSNNENGFFFIGGTESENRSFVEKVSRLFKSINVNGRSHGYLDHVQEQDLIAHIVRINPGVVVVGLGAGKQEQFSKQLIVQGYSGRVFTCGAFISQESTKDGEYYPPIINKLNLRFLFRMYKEPHTIKRYLVDYPLNFTNLIYLIALGKITFNIR